MGKTYFLKSDGRKEEISLADQIRYVTNKKAEDFVNGPMRMTPLKQCNSFVLVIVYAKLNKICWIRILD